MKKFSKIFILPSNKSREHFQFVFPPNPQSGESLFSNDFDIFQGGKGASQAIKEANRQEEMFVVGFGAVPDALDAVKAGGIKLR